MSPATVWGVGSQGRRAVRRSGRGSGPVTWTRRLQECLRAQKIELQRGVFDAAAFDAAEQREKALRKARRAAARRLRCLRRGTAWAQRAAVAAELNERIRAVPLPPPACPRSQARASEEAPLRVGSPKSSATQETTKRFLNARASQAVDLGSRPRVSRRVAAVPDGERSVGDVALIAACVFVACGLPFAREPGAVAKAGITRATARARAWQERDRFWRDVEASSEAAPSAATVAVAKWFYCGLRGLFARKCGGAARLRAEVLPWHRDRRREGQGGAERGRIRG